MSKYYLTTPIYYVNDKPHIGHAYTTIAADILARYWRKKGRDVFFLAGSDEHGKKIEQAAKRANLSVKEFVDKASKVFMDTWKKLKISNDFFIRTTDPAHVLLVQNFLKEVFKKGDIYRGTYCGLYCVSCEAYLREDELNEGRCPIHKQIPERIKEKVYFFRLSKFQKELIALIQDKKLDLEPEERRNEVLSFLQKQTLEDLAISRSKVKWGIPLPWDNNQTVYVWVDALLNYVSAPQMAGEKLWPANLHLLAKDILRFHAIIWPALLLSAGMELPKKIFIHGYLTSNGEKMSKTRGNVIDPLFISKKYGIEALRYYLFREVAFGKDGDFSEKKLKNVYNSELSNELGNLLQRTLTMINKYRVKISKDKAEKRIERSGIEEAIENLRFKEALQGINDLVKKANTLIDEKKPWKLYPKVKQASSVGLTTDRQKQFYGLFENLIGTLSVSADLLEPFMPESSAKIKNQLETKNPKPVFPKIE